MLARLNNLFILFIALLSVVVALPSQTTGRSLDTNAKRFARGLPPLAPVVKKRKGSAVEAAKRSLPSTGPMTTYTGKIRIRKAVGGGVVGWITDNLDNGVYTVDNSSNDAVQVSFTCATTGPSTQVEIKDTSNNRAMTPFIGGTGTSALAAGSGNFISVAGVSHTNGGVPPTSGFNTVNTVGSVESSIWKFDPSTSLITAQWINTGGSTPPTIIYYNPGTGLVFTGDGDKYDDTHSSAYAVTLTLI